MAKKKKNLVEKLAALQFKRDLIALGVDLLKSPIVGMIAGVCAVNAIYKAAPDYLYSEQTRGYLQGAAIGFPIASALTGGGGGGGPLAGLTDYIPIIAGAAAATGGLAYLGINELGDVVREYQPKKHWMGKAAGYLSPQVALLRKYMPQEIDGIQVPIP